MITTIASSDKLTLSMFSDFYKTLYSPDMRLIDLSCLYSEDILKTKLNEISEMANSGRDIFIKFKMKPQTKVIPPLLIEKSDLLIKFDIYSTVPEVIKDFGPETENLLNRWKMNIEKFNAQKI